jgi:hypothetical protein
MEKEIDNIERAVEIVVVPGTISNGHELTGMLPWQR